MDFHLFRLLTRFWPRVVGLNLAREVETLALVENLDRVKPVRESGKSLDVVGVCGTLQQFDLRQNLEFFSTLVKVNQPVRDHVPDGCVDHGQIGQEGTEIRNRSVTDRLKRNNASIMESNL